MPNSLSRAPWRDLLDDHLDRTQTPRHEFTIATVQKTEQGRSLPRLRVCGFRGFFPEVNLHPNGEKDMQEQVANGGNPALFESDMLSFTTDRRMEKLRQLESCDGEIEALFWFADVGAQWRIRGRAFAIGDPKLDENDGEARGRDVIKTGMRMKPAGEIDRVEKESWSWEHAVTRYFANHSPIARGTFKAPPPGCPVQRGLGESYPSQGQVVTDLYDTVARDNFRVVVIIPWEVEQLDLSDSDCLHRQRWTLDGDAGGEGLLQWIQTELYP